MGRVKHNTFMEALKNTIERHHMRHTRHVALISTYCYRSKEWFSLGIYGDSLPEMALTFLSQCNKHHDKSKFYYIEMDVALDLRGTVLTYRSSWGNEGVWFKYDDVQGLKKCSRCDERKLSQAFPSRGCICRDCVNHDRREKNRDETRRTINLERARLYRNNNRVRALLYGAKSRAKNNGLPFDLEPADIVIPSVCPVFGTPLVWDGKDDDKPSLDRLKPSLGYVKGNVHVISLRANRIKNDGRVTELAAIAEWMKRAS